MNEIQLELKNQLENFACKNRPHMEHMMNETFRMEIFHETWRLRLYRNDSSRRIWRMGLSY